MKLYCGDCLEILPTLDENSIDACVTDPPYHLTSIVNRFGKTSQGDETITSDRARRGSDGMARLSRGFMGKQWDGGDIAFRTETWAAVYRVLKPGAHLIAFGGTRTYHRMACAIEDAGFEIRDQIQWLYGSGFPKSHNQGNGWGTALKPANEPMVLARKPLSEKTVAANVLKWGTGAINVDGCRVEAADQDKLSANWDRMQSEKQSDVATALSPKEQIHLGAYKKEGRWPANVIHDGSEEVVGAFPESSVTGNRSDKSKCATVDGTNWLYSNHKSTEHLDSGSAARFFYCAKASRADRNSSKHPTVKPLKLMRYLCRLITPPGGTILDPFAGSGTTGQAARDEGFRAALIEREAEYQNDIRRRSTA